MSGAEIRKTQVDISGLMQVLGKNLYSTPTVAIRELVQNAHDSCVRRRLEDTTPIDPYIVVAGQPDASVIVIEDNGAGLTKEEIEKYLATVGAGYTRTLRAETADDSDLIGMFGLGFLSAFIVSARVDVFTTSFSEPNKGWHFSSRNGESYTIASTDPRPVGTRVELHLSTDFDNLANELSTTSLLEHYCCLLPIPVYADLAKAKQVNEVPPPWRLEGDPSSLRMKRLRLQFAQKFESFFEPICAIPLSASKEEPGEGLLWIQDGSTFGTSDNRNVSVFVRGMLVSRNERDLVPTWAGFVGGVIASNRLKPTASREDLQKDDTYYGISARIHEALVDGLSEIAQNQPEIWRRILARHNEALLGAALCDDRLFELLADDLKVPTSAGDLTLPAILQRAQGKLYVSIGDKGSSEEVLFRALLVPIVNGTRYGALPFCVRYAERKGATVVQLGTEEGNREIFQRVDIDAQQQQTLEGLLKTDDDQALIASRFKPAELPLIMIPDREVELKRRIESDEADRRIGSAVLGLARLYTSTVQERPRSQLYVNLDSPVVGRLLEAEPGKQRLAADLLRSLCTLIASHGDATIPADLPATLKSFMSSVIAVLDSKESGD